MSQQPAQEMEVSRMISHLPVNATPTVVPSLQRWEGASGATTLHDGFRVLHAWEELAQTAASLVQDLAEVAGVHGSVLATDNPAAAAREGDIVLALNSGLDFGTDHASAAPEGYVLTVDGVSTVTGRSVTGVFWGTRTLLQMAAKSTALPHGTAVDWPNYAVRGFMLDVGRRFAEAGFLRDYIRFMSWFKLNTFHIHLNDNGFMRYSSNGWAGLQQAFRLASDNPAFSGLAATDGSYNRADWDSFEEVAAAHHVTLVPEIDVPGHAHSIIKWKPEIGLNGGESDMLDLKNPDTIEVVRGIFDEFTPWFRGQSVHFGADEYEKGHGELYQAFFNDVAAHLRSLDKDPIAWGSISIMSGEAGTPADGYSRDVVMCSWNNDWYGAQAAVADGYKIINTNDSLLYIVPFADYYHGSGLDGQSLFETWEPHVFGPGKSLYPQHPQLLGAASAVWNDLVLHDYNEQDLHALIEPTFAVLAQKMWVGAVPGLGYADFTQQLGTLSNWPGREFLAPILVPSQP